MGGLETNQEMENCYSQKDEKCVTRGKKKKATWRGRESEDLPNW